jgi:nucleotide-binding universal stress UspA family protein
MIERILVALDDTAVAPRVLAVGTEIAERFDASLHLFRAVLVPPEFPAAAAHAAAADPLPEHLAAEARAMLLRYAAGNARALAHPPEVGFGDPWRAIVEASDRLEVDLVVVGSHLYHWPDRVLGTVAGELANRGHCNVLVVRR